MMFREEWRQNVDFAKKRHILLFPALLSIVAMVASIGLRYLVGEGVQSDAVLVDEYRRAFTWQEMRFALHFPLFTKRFVCFQLTESGDSSIQMPSDTSSPW